MYGGVSPSGFSSRAAVAWGWRKFTQFLGPVMVGVAIYVGFVIVTEVLAIAVSAAASVAGDVTGNAQAFTVVDWAFQAVLTVASWIGGTLLAGAAARAALDVADGRRYDFLNACRRVPVVKLLIATLLLGLASVIVLLAAVVPLVLAGVFLHLSLWVLVPLGIAILIAFGFVATGFQYLLVFAIVDQPAIGINLAFVACGRLARTHLGDALMLGLWLTLVAIVGLLACGVGLLVAYPVTHFAMANAYRRFQTQSVAP